MSDFLREDRYLVIKYADMSAALTGAEREAMARLVEKIDGHRRRRDKDVLKAVVVEHDWPEYESVWKMIESRVSGVEQPQAACRGDGRCQYAIDSGAEGIAHCPKGKCVMPQQVEAVPQGWGEHEIAQAAMEAEIPDSKLESLLLALPQRVTQPQAEAVPTIYVSRRQLENLKPDPEDEAGTYLPVRKTPKGKFTHPLFAAPQQAEHDLKDVRCDYCGYMTYQREHMNCIRSAQPQAEAVPADQSKWCAYIAGVIGCYLGEADDSTRVKAIAGIIERRLWALAPQRAEAVLRCPDSIDGRHDFGPDGGRCAGETCTAVKPFAAPQQAEAVPDVVRDAERYRWLFSSHTEAELAECDQKSLQPPHTKQDETLALLGGWYTTKEQADKAIDAAIEQQKGSV